MLGLSVCSETRDSALLKVGLSPDITPPPPKKKKKKKKTVTFYSEDCFRVGLWACGLDRSKLYLSAQSRSQSRHFQLPL